MRVRYINFWPDFDPYNNWFGHMLRDYFKEDVEVSLNSDSADIILSSIFGDEPFVSGKINILYTGENRGIKRKHDGVIYLGFHQTDLNEKIFRLPYWMTCINWWPNEFYPRNYVGGNIINLNNYRPAVDAETIASRKFCSIVASNGVSNRFDIVENLSNVDVVECFGSAFNNRVEENKIDIIKNYNFNICYENSIGPGYVTEKLFEALLASTIPIYWGSEFCGNDFNPQSFVNTTDMSRSEVFDSIKYLHRNPGLVEEKCNTPMFNSPPSLDNLYEFFDKMGIK
jgi:hypothetical protein